MTGPPTAPTLTAYARTAGWLYLVIIVCAGFGEGYVRGTLVVPGDAAATAANLLASEGLFRLGLVADLVAFLADAGVAVLLYVVLRPVSRTLSLAAAAFRLVAHPAIGSLNLLNHFGALAVLQSGSLAGFGEVQRESLALLALDLHGYGYLIAGAFFGVHCALLGVLLYRSELFPRLLGILMACAAAGYLIETGAAFLAPSLDAAASALVVVTAGIGEVSLCLYLIVRGTRAPDEEA
ncbi:MAG: DUF4386 domain-containing protein [Longimicrobiales bacterium]